MAANGGGGGGGGGGRGMDVHAIVEHLITTTPEQRGLAQNHIDARRLAAHLISIRENAAPEHRASTDEAYVHACEDVTDTQVEYFRFLVGSATEAEEAARNRGADDDVDPGSPLIHRVSTTAPLSDYSDVVMRLVVRQDEVREFLGSAMRSMNDRHLRQRNSLQLQLDSSYDRFRRKTEAIKERVRVLRAQNAEMERQVERKDLRLASKDARIAELERLARA